jgi:hypothetical protein
VISKSEFELRREVVHFEREAADFRDDSCIKERGDGDRGPVTVATSAPTPGAMAVRFAACAFAMPVEGFHDAPDRPEEADEGTARDRRGEHDHPAFQREHFLSPSPRSAAPRTLFIASDGMKGPGHVVIAVAVRLRLPSAWARPPPDRVSISSQDSR